MVVSEWRRTAQLTSMRIAYDTEYKKFFIDIDSYMNSIGDCATEPVTKRWKLDTPTSGVMPAPGLQDCVSVLLDPLPAVPMRSEYGICRRLEQFILQDLRPLTLIVRLNRAAWSSIMKTRMRNYTTT